MDENLNTIIEEIEKEIGKVFLLGTLLTYKKSDLSAIDQIFNLNPN